MNEADRRKAFADAFAAQGRSDWRVYQYLASLQSPSFPVCHSFHYLQMATEKIAKAYRIRDTASDVDDLARHHPGFEEFVNAFFRSPQIRSEYVGKDSALRALQTNAAALAREIEKLAPATDRSAAPENAEYPWERDDCVFRPCEYGYPNLSFLKAHSGRATMNMISRAFSDYETLRIF